MVTVTADPLLDGPCPRAGLTITGLGVGDSIVTVWRIDGAEDRSPVPGYRRALMNDSTYFTDFYPPRGVPITYEVEVISGPGGASRTTSAPLTVDSPDSVTGWIMDPLIPQTAIPVTGRRDSTGFELMASSLKELEYAADVSIFEVMGSDKPMALVGKRMAARGVQTKIATRSAEQNARLQNLLSSTAYLHFRPAPAWGNLHLGGSLFLANPSARQLPITPHWGGMLTWWDLKSDVVAAPSIRVLTATFTYGDVALLFSTYQQKQDLMAGKTYLDDLKNPIGG